MTLNKQKINRKEQAALLAPAIRMLIRQGSRSIVSYYYAQDIQKIIQSEKTFTTAQKKISENSLIKKINILFINSAIDIETQYAKIKAAIRKHRKSQRYIPILIAIQHIGLFAGSDTKAGADAIIQNFIDATLGRKKRTSSGKSIPDESPLSKTGKVADKIAIVTGSAQGFGKGIAQALADEGAHVVIADINGSLAKKTAAWICTRFNSKRALAVTVDITREDSLKKLMIETILAYGGIDIFIANAGILQAGSLEDMDLKTFERVTKINYAAYYLCTKYASRYMKIQSLFDKNYLSDIIQINSKSGLEGSNKNFAYAGAKFGGIGLTQSFALELVEFNIKVNAICPGNFFEGPLWADPKKGLFAQYLTTGKVPVAKTIEDVKRFYENKVPMKRGCSIRDVASAVFYCIEQCYETGQAIPVTGGQVMLK